MQWIGEGSYSRLEEAAMEVSLPMEVMERRES